MREIGQERITREINSNVSKNYKLVKDEYNLSYGYIKLDPLRDEICKCLVCDLNQAAITLTNHLLESSLKYFLTIKYSKENKPISSFWGSLFKSGIKKHEKLYLSETIKLASRKNLITDNQEERLNYFRENYRNPYGHASSKIFGNMKLSGKIVTVPKDGNVEKFIADVYDATQYHSTNVKDFLPIQGIAQVIKAQETALPYFKEVDKIIRDIIVIMKEK